MIEVRPPEKLKGMKTLGRTHKIVYNTCHYQVLECFSSQNLLATLNRDSNVRIG